VVCHRLASGLASSAPGEGPGRGGAKKTLFVDMKVGSRRFSDAHRVNTPRQGNAALRAFCVR
jgi:hypothetical protein